MEGRRKDMPVREMDCLSLDVDLVGAFRFRQIPVDTMSGNKNNIPGFDWLWAYISMTTGHAKNESHSRVKAFEFF